MAAITEDDSGSISIDKMHTKQSKAEAYENTVENVEDSDSDLTDLEDLEEDANLE